MRTWMKTARRKLKLSQEDVAKQVGICRSYYCMIEKNKKRQDLNLEMIGKLSEIFEIPVERIVELERRK